ncbi:MAG: MBOAT family protein, partial [Saprospiraceae bacterium]|nr:MBOAT family protein [Saprospiraceae bacterium]
WFRDYLYIPLGGSRVSEAKIVRNILLVFLVSGLWHGANWTFLAWGAMHAILFIPLIIRNQHRSYLKVIGGFKALDGLRIISTFLLVSLCWVFFRSENIAQAMAYYSGLIDASIFQLDQPLNFILLLWIALMLIVEWSNRTKLHGLEIETWNPWIRRGIYFSLITIIFLFGNLNEVEFIYFAF